MSREHIHTPKNLGERIADGVTATMGSWRFIIIQTLFLLVWAMLNSLSWWPWKWDGYPFIAMNLLLSCQAAYASPMILMSQNRQAAKDQARDNLEAEEVAHMFSSHELLLQINQQQLEILRLLQQGKEAQS